MAVSEQIGLSLELWQQDIADIMFALRADGSLAADTVCISVPRQAGKTFLVAAAVFAECLITAGTTVAWTAHHNKVMLETFRTLKTVAESSRVAPHIATSGIKASAEDRSINFANGSRIVMAARESGALRGVAKVRVLVLDEAQKLSEDAMSDILPTQNRAEHPLTVMLGTPPRPRDDGEVFTQQRGLALKAERAGAPLELSTWIEFSADEDADTDDKEQLRKANPSYPKHTPLRVVRKLRRMLSEDNFRREALGIWDDKSTPTVISESTWDALGDVDSLGAERLALGIDVAPDRSVSSVAVAGIRSDALWHVELVQNAEGVGWVVDEVAEICDVNPIMFTVVDARSPAASLVPEFRRRGVHVLETNTGQMADACDGFYDAAVQNKVRHIEQDQLTDALMQARRRSIGERWAWNRKSVDSDITPLVAATLALWGSQLVDDKPRRVRVMR